MSVVSCLYDPPGECVLSNTRETSNKALNAINQINLVPFLMSFLASRKKLPVSTVTAAGAWQSSFPSILTQCSVSAAHCLYVLTDDNYPAINDIRSNSAYIICLLEVIRQEQVFQNGKTTEPSDERETAFRVLVSGPSSYLVPWFTPIVTSTNT